MIFFCPFMKLFCSNIDKYSILDIIRTNLESPYPARSDATSEIGRNNLHHRKGLLGRSFFIQKNSSRVHEFTSLMKNALTR